MGHWLRQDWTFGDVGAHWDAVEDYDAINEETYSYFRRFVDGLRLGGLGDNLHVLDICARPATARSTSGNMAKCVRRSVRMSQPRWGKFAGERLNAGGFTDFTWLQLFDYPLPLATASFDAVLCFETVEHLAQPARLVAELGRVTRPGGTLILTTPNVLWEPVHALAAVTGLHHSEGPHHFIRYGRLRRMILDAGFRNRTRRDDRGSPWRAGAASCLRRAAGRKDAAWLMPWIGLRRVIVARKR